MSFRAVLAAEALWDGEARGVSVAGTRVLLVRVDGAVHAYEDRCAHKGVALSEGRLDGRVLTCRAHGWQYDVCAGGGINPASATLRRFAVREENGDIWVDVDEANDVRRV